MATRTRKFLLSPSRITILCWKHATPSSYACSLRLSSSSTCNHIPNVKVPKNPSLLEMEGGSEGICGNHRGFFVVQQTDAYVINTSMPRTHIKRICRWLSFLSDRKHCTYSNIAFFFRRDATTIKEDVKERAKYLNALELQTSAAPNLEREIKGKNWGNHLRCDDGPRN